MPPAVAAAGIGAAASLGGALISRSGQNKALGAQERAANAQIQLERERDAARGERYERAYKSYESEKSQYDQIRRALLGHYGVNVGGAPGGGGGGDVRGGMGYGGGVSLGQLMGGGAPSAVGGAPAAAPGPAGAAPGPEAPPEVAGDAFDWRNYGVR